MKKLNVILIALDFEKAFDTVNWKAFYKILSLFNFGTNFISMVKKLLPIYTVAH